MHSRSELLARRLEQGATALAALAASLTDAEWQARVPGDGRTVGVVVHHVASVYPVEVGLAQTLAAGQPVTDVTMDDVHTMNAKHAAANAGATKADTVALLQRNSAKAAATIRAISNDELDRAMPASLYADAPVTCQFMLEDHAVRHSFHHLARIRSALQR
jgi:hypothetical protein